MRMWGLTYDCLHFFLPLPTITDVEQRHERARDQFFAQLTLADECTRLVHGDQAVVEAKRVTHALFANSQAVRAGTTTLDSNAHAAEPGPNGVNENIHEEQENSGLRALSAQELDAVLQSVPRMVWTRDELLRADILTLLVASKAASSKGDGRRLIANGGIYLNELRVTDELFRVSPADLLHGRLLVIRKGKKTQFVFQVQQ